MIKKYDNGGNTRKKTKTYEQTKTGSIYRGTNESGRGNEISDIKASTSKTNRKGNTVTKTFSASDVESEGGKKGFGTVLSPSKGSENPKGTKTRTVTDAQGNVIKSNTKEISSKRAIRKAAKIRDTGAQSSYTSGNMKTYKTGGMVNANANLKATATAGSKGVKSGVNPKAAASKTAKKPSASRSKAPKKATPGRR